VLGNGLGDELGIADGLIEGSWVVGNFEGLVVGKVEGSWLGDVDGE